MSHTPNHIDPIIPGCPNKTLVTNPNTGNGEFNNIIDAMDRIVALHGPNAVVSDYKFFLSVNGLQSAAPSLANVPTNWPLSFFQNMPEEDGNGNYLVSPVGFVFLYFNQNNINLGIGQYSVTNIPVSLIPNQLTQLFNVYFDTFQQFFDACNSTIFPHSGYDVLAPNVLYGANPVSNACKLYRGYLEVNNLATNPGTVMGSWFDMWKYGCSFGVEPCPPELVTNPCYALGASLQISQTYQTYNGFQYGGTYTTGQFTNVPQNLSTAANPLAPAGTYWMLVVPGYDNANPFTFDTQTNTANVITQLQDYWMPCGLYTTNQGTDMPAICTCEEHYDYNNPTTLVTPNSTGNFNPSQSYFLGDTFLLDWYTTGLSILVNHPSQNFVDYIVSQNLNNPIGMFELPDYDFITNQWINGPSGLFVHFTGPCNDEPGISCYMKVVGPSGPPFPVSAPSFYSATQAEISNGFVLPGFASLNTATTPYWAGPAGGTINGYILSSNPDVNWYADQGMAMLNRSMVCCEAFKEGCMDITALNYNPAADILCPDNDGDGLPDCCLYNATAEAEECLPKLTKEEFLMNVAQKPETRSDVFIERGKTSVFERTQRLAQTPTIGELELHGYGYYKINEQRF